MTILGLALRPVTVARVCSSDGVRRGCFDTEAAFSRCVSSLVVRMPLSCYTPCGQRSKGRRRFHVTRAGSGNESSGASLAHICHRIEFCFFETCVRNLGRPAGLSLHDFVAATVEAFNNGYTWEQMSLQLTFGSAGMQEFELGMAGCRLTAAEERYRSKWLDTVYTSLQIMKIKDNKTSKLAMTEDMHLYSTVRHVIEGQISGNEQSFINFDRGLATRGASGGVAAEKVVIAPQLVPISQLVLLTLKVVNEQGPSM